MLNTASRLEIYVGEVDKMGGKDMLNTNFSFQRLVMQDQAVSNFSFRRLGKQGPAALFRYLCTLRNLPQCFGAFIALSRIGLRLALTYTSLLVCGMRFF